MALFYHIIGILTTIIIIIICIKNCGSLKLIFQTSRYPLILAIYLLNGYPILILVPKTQKNIQRSPPALATAAAKATGDAPAIGAIKTCPKSNKTSDLSWNTMGFNRDLMGFNGI